MTKSELKEIIKECYSEIMNDNNNDIVEESVDINAVNEDSIVVEEAEYIDYLYNGLIAETADFDNMVAGLVTVEEGAGEVIKTIIKKIKDMIDRFINFIKELAKKIKFAVSKIVSDVRYKIVVNKLNNAAKSKEGAEKLSKFLSSKSGAKMFDEAAERCKKKKTAIDRVREERVKHAIIEKLIKDYKASHPTQESAEIVDETSYDFNKLSGSDIAQLYYLTDNTVINSEKVLTFFKEYCDEATKSASEIDAIDKLRNDEGRLRSDRDGMDQIIEHLGNIKARIINDTDDLKDFIVYAPIGFKRVSVTAKDGVKYSEIDKIESEYRAKLKKVNECIDALNRHLTDLQAIESKVTKFNQNIDGRIFNEFAHGVATGIRYLTAVISEYNNYKDDIVSAVKHGIDNIKVMEKAIIRESDINNTNDNAGVSSTFDKSFDDINSDDEYYNKVK